MDRRGRNSRLNKVFSSARALAEACFARDLPPGILANAALWDRLKKHDAIINNIPVPQSNSAVAKQLRLAAFMALLARELHKHVFQPTYLFRHHAGVGRVLDELEDVSPAWETHLRSTLLAASEHAVDETASATRERVRAVAQKVSECVLELIPEKQREDFRARLEALCGEACEQWKFIQRLDARVEPDFEGAEDEGPSWKLFIPNHKSEGPPAKARRNSASAGQATATASTSTPTTGKNARSTPAGSQSQWVGAAAAGLADGVVVWPAFYNGSSEAVETLVPGYVLTAGQVAAGKAEEKAQRLTGPRRESREQSRSLRAMSISGNGGGGGGGQEQPGGQGQGQNGFLSRGSGGGLPGA